MSISTFGTATDPAVLLIAGVGSTMDWWPPAFCEALAQDHFVIRYDHRDTGDAPSYPPGEPGYSGMDLVSDAVAVLDAVGVDAAHVMGISMGGAIAQEVALHHPTRVRTLTLVSTTAGAGDDDLPGVAEGLTEPPEPDWSDDAAVVEYLVESQRAVAAEPYDEDEVRTIARLAVSRTKNHESSQKNHFMADGGDPWRARLPEITVPALVLHGDADPLFPLPHGEALARELRNARLVVLPNTGHEFPRRNWPLVLAELRRLVPSG